VAEPEVVIPNRPHFKASEVCELASIPPYVLRSWEKEFPGLGVSVRAGGPRVYRKADIEQILKIKQLVFEQGLTLAGARRKLEGEPPPEAEPDFLPFAPPSEDVRLRVATAKRELRSLLEMLKPREADAEGRTPAAAEATDAVRNGADAASTSEDVPDSSVSAGDASAAPAGETQIAASWPPAAPAKTRRTKRAAK
jgi:DNA-binding transcriptional MerR regulator